MEGKTASEMEDQQLAEALARSQTEADKPSGSNPGAAVASGSTPAVGTGAGIKPDDKFTEANVQTLIGYGFPRDMCIEELRLQNGDVTQATAALFAKALKVPKK